MPKLKNVRPGVFIITDANLRLSPGETIEVKTTTSHMAWALAEGYLVQSDATIDEPEPPEPSGKGRNRSHNKRKAILDAINKKDKGEDRADD